VGMCWTPKHAPQACVLVFKRRGGGVDVSDTKNTPQTGMFLVFEMRGRRGGCIRHQNTPLLGAFWVSSMRGRGASAKCRKGFLGLLNPAKPL